MESALEGCHYCMLYGIKLSLLVLDKSPSHCNKEIIKEFSKNNTYYAFITDGLTRYLQPLDIGIKILFKNNIKKELLLAGGLLWMKVKK